MTAPDVLVVDDEDVVRTVLSRRLQSWGYVVNEAASASEALERMSSRPAAIAIIDVRMPGEDGIWLTEQIRQRWPGTAVIIATGADDLGGVDAAALGAVGHVMKPFDQKLLREALVIASGAVK